MTPNPSNSRQPEETARGGRRPLHLLLAEDDLPLREILAEALRADGHRVTEVADGNQLARRILLAARDGSGPFDLVITDIRMPGRSGLLVLDALGTLPTCPPFIFMTGFGDEAVRRQAERLGAVGLLDKPFSPRALRELVKRQAPGVS